MSSPMKRSFFNRSTPKGSPSKRPKVELLPTTIASLKPVKQPTSLIFEGTLEEKTSILSNAKGKFRTAFFSDGTGIVTIFLPEEYFEEFDHLLAVGNRYRLTMPFATVKAAESKSTARVYYQSIAPGVNMSIESMGPDTGNRIDVADIKNVKLNYFNPTFYGKLTAEFGELQSELDFINACDKCDRVVQTDPSNPESIYCMSCKVEVKLDETKKSFASTKVKLVQGGQSILVTCYKDVVEKLLGHDVQYFYDRDEIPTFDHLRDKSVEVRIKKLFTAKASQGANMGSDENSYVVIDVELPETSDAADGS